eukprot:m.606810 g.606810  ORF g.606810 m.606810 type:complete len:558 (-) comp58113_c0_seq2:147-1820(-)
MSVYDPVSRSHVQAATLPVNPLSCILHNDLYQVTMAYAYWKTGKHEERSTFDVVFRKNPFAGEYTIFAGLEECIRLLKAFQFTADDVEFLRERLPATTEPEFFRYLQTLTTAGVEVFAQPEGSVVFPQVPLVRVEGPLAVCQILETPFLNLINFASLVATNAVRFRYAAGDTANLLEFGLRRAQGPDGALSASRYCYVGGFDATSNILAAKLFGIPVAGTHAHAFVSSFSPGDTLPKVELRFRDGTRSCPDFPALVQEKARLVDEKYRAEFTKGFNPHKGELLAFTAYAMSFPDGFIALADTYDVNSSGVPNFCAVALALHDLGYVARGIRLDSGDLAYLSVQAREVFVWVAKTFEVPSIGKSNIIASNDINEDTIWSIKSQSNSIDAYGIGTHLVTCQSQPALGCVYKLVNLNGQPRMKLSQEVRKITIPGRKQAFRLFGLDGSAICDLLQLETEEPPKPGQKLLCRHPFEENKRAYVIPTKVQPLHVLYWKDSAPVIPIPTIMEVREHVRASLGTIRKDHRRQLNPTPFKVSVSAKLYAFLHELWLDTQPVGELS